MLPTKGRPLHDPDRRIEGKPRLWTVSSGCRSGCGDELENVVDEGCADVGFRGLAIPAAGVLTMTPGPIASSRTWRNREAASSTPRNLSRVAMSALAPGRVGSRHVRRQGDAVVFVDRNVEGKVDGFARHVAPRTSMRSRTERSMVWRRTWTRSMVPWSSNQPVGSSVTKSECGDLDGGWQASPRRATAITDDRTESSLDQLGGIQAVGELPHLSGGLTDRIHHVADRGAVEQGVGTGAQTLDRPVVEEPLDLCTHGGVGAEQPFAEPSGLRQPSLAHGQQLVRVERQPGQVGRGVERVGRGRQRRCRGPALRSVARPG